MIWNMIGHQWAATILKQHIVSGSVRHAYLFTGPDHVGKATLAERFAQSINCREGEPGNACGECRSCRLIAGRRHPDLHVLEVQEDRTLIRIEQVRELQYALSLAPYEADRRIALLPDFHLATYHAWNALLKTLEEPSSRVVLLLTAPSVEMLLPTIVSRCEVIPLRPIDTVLLETHLVGEGYDPQKVEVAARLSMGSPGLAHMYLQDEGLLKEQFGYCEDLFDWLRLSSAGRLQKAERWMNWRQSFPMRQARLKAMLQTWVGVWRDILIQQYHEDSVLIHRESAAQVSSAADGFDPGRVLDQLRRTERGLEELLSNADPRLLLESIVLNLPDGAFL